MSLLCSQETAIPPLLSNREGYRSKTEQSSIFDLHEKTTHQADPLHVCDLHTVSGMGAVRVMAGQSMV